jgi:hypothetical protein
MKRFQKRIVGENSQTPASNWILKWSRNRNGSLADASLAPGKGSWCYKLKEEEKLNSELVEQLRQRRVRGKKGEVGGHDWLAI